MPQKLHFHAKIFHLDDSSCATDCKAVKSIASPSFNRAPEKYSHFVGFINGIESNT